MSESFCVTEAKHRDAGRGIARIDSKKMGELEITSGDIVKIEGDRDAYAVAWPSYPKEKGRGTVRIDGNIRNNAGAGIDDQVEIEKSSAEDAERVDISPAQPVELVRGSEYMGKVLEGQPVKEGQQIRANVLGTSHTFLVESTKPSGVVVVRPETEIHLSEEMVKEGRAFVTYEDVGGLERELERVREMIEIPLKNPDMFKKVGIEPPKGVLLHGPPGTGKTLISKAVANEVDANFYTISGPEIIGKLYGESEERLREVFEKARSNSPAVVLIDEIDAIAPKRSEMSGERMVERRVVNQLLSILDGLESRGEVIVIGATNQPDLLDPALRRGGRFDREIEIGIPDKEGRKEILEVHTRGMHLGEGVSLDELSELTYGYVGADLETLCKEAAMRALRRIIPEMDFESGEIPPEAVETLEVSEEDFTEAVKTTAPSAIKEVFTETPDVGWEDVGGLEKAKQRIRESVEWPLKYRELFDEYEAETPKGILLYGPPGTGKTLLAKAVANESDANFISIKGPELLSKFVGESERGIREMFRKAKQASPCVIFFDELDAVAPERSQRSDSQVTERVVSQILTELDGLEELKDVVTIAATNRPDMIDRALLRPGRMDSLVYTPAPDEDERRKIFEVHLRNKRLADDVDLDSLAERTENYVGADIAAICREATMFAIREEIEEEKAGSEEAKNGVLMQDHFERALEEVEPSVSAEDLKSYEETGEEFREFESN